MSKRLNRSSPNFVLDIARPQGRFMDDWIFKILPLTKFNFHKNLKFFWKYTKGIEFLPHTLIFNFYISTTRCRRHSIFQTMNSVRLNNLSFKYQKFISSGCKDIEIRTFKFVAKTQFLCYEICKNYFVLFYNVHKRTCSQLK